jgi:chromosome partitioning protein
LGAQVIEEVRSHFGDRVYSTVIPRLTRLAEAPSYGEPIVDFDPHSRAAQVYEELAKEVMAAHGE